MISNDDYFIIPDRLWHAAHERLKAASPKLMQRAVAMGLFVQMLSEMKLPDPHYPHSDEHLADKAYLPLAYARRGLAVLAAAGVILPRQGKNAAIILDLKSLALDAP